MPHSLPQSRADGPKKTWLVTGSPAEGPLCPVAHPLLASFTWLIFLSRSFVSIFLPFAIPGPHSMFKATWLLASFRGRQVEKRRVYSLIPSPLETALVCSTCSRYQHPSVRRHWAQLECTEAAVDKGTYSALQRWRLRSAHGSRIPGSTSETPWSQQPLSVSSAFTWLPSSPGSQHMCWWQSWNHRGDSSEEAVQCLWGCACNKEFPWRPVCKRDR